MKRFVLVLFVSGCFPQPQPQQPQAQPQHQDLIAAGCQSNVQRGLATWCTTPPSPLPPGWSEAVRRSADSQLRGGCAPAIVQPLAQCATRLEAIALAEDPDAKARRAAAAPKAEATRQDPAFKQRVDAWYSALDAMKIICRNRKVSSAHARECSRSEEDFGHAQDALRAFLLGKGFDARDIGELGLWPSDPDGLAG
jgi:hypothetical protein